MLTRESFLAEQIKIWEDHKSSPIAVLRPHNGLPVNSVTFLTAPRRPDHIILITGVCAESIFFPINTFFVKFKNEVKSIVRIRGFRSRDGLVSWSKGQLLSTG